MAWNKKYTHLKPFKHVICIDSSGCTLLKTGKRAVIKQTTTKYLIQFYKSRAANWYSKERFVDMPIKQEPIKANQLF